MTYFTPASHHHPTRMLLLGAALLALPLTACDTPGTNAIDTLEPFDGLSQADQALVTRVFHDVEALFDFGWDLRGRAPSDQPVPLSEITRAFKPGAAAKAMIDTTRYTGLINTAGHGFLVTLTYREPQGVPLWRLRLQHGTRLHGQTGDPDAVETINLAFLQYPDLAAFVSKLEAGTVPYLIDHQDPSGSFSDADEWDIARLTALTDGGAVLTYNDDERSAEIVIRDPIITINSDGSATVRDGQSTGWVRTRYYRPDFAIDASGVITAGTLERTLYSYGDAVDGSVVSRNAYPDGSFRQTKQRGGDGVVIRENTEG